MSGIPRLLIPKEYEKPWLNAAELYDIQNLRRAIYELVNRQREQFTNEFNDWVR